MLVSFNSTDAELRKLPLGNLKGEPTGRASRERAPEGPVGGRRPSRVERPRLVASADGAIEKLLLTLPAWILNEELSGYFEARVRELFASMGPETTFVILTQPEGREKIQAWTQAEGLATDRVRWVMDEHHIRFTFWAQDPLFVLLDGDTPFFAEPIRFSRAADTIVADLVAHDLELGHTQVPLVLHGGNLLAGDDFYLLGLDHVRATERLLEDLLVPREGISPRERVGELFDSFVESSRKRIDVGSDDSEEPLIPGPQSRMFYQDGEMWTEHFFRGTKEAGSWQPLFHIDMFITLAGRGDDGRYRLVVADPFLARDMLAAEAPSHPWPDHGNITASLLGKVASELKGEFQVIHNPVPLVFTDDAETRTRHWYFAAYNNALVELGVHLADGRIGNKIYLPSYAHAEHKFLHSIDRRNREIWEELGFEVVLLGDYNLFASSLGAVHCITKDLLRAAPLTVGRNA